MAFTRHGHYFADVGFGIDFGIGEDPILDCEGLGRCDECYEDMERYYKEAHIAKERVRQGEQPECDSGGPIRDAGKDRPSLSRWTYYPNRGSAR